MQTGITYALLAAALFGASTPFAKMLVDEIAPVMLAGLLYLGSGIGLTAWMIVRRMASGNGGDNGARLASTDLPWLAGAVIAGGIAGPVLLMIGLTSTPASSASLLLNLEGVLTALMAWFVFKENVDRQVALGMGLIVAAGLLLAWDERPVAGPPWGAIAIAAACLCWSVDNNLTRKVSAGDAVQIAGIKGIAAGSVNLGIAFMMDFRLPETNAVLSAGLIGFCGYGLSLVLFVLALRNLGTARTGAYFSAAPFVGAVVSLALLQDMPGTAFWIAAVLMAAGIWLHITETHSHLHAHEEMFHNHPHRHDAHHQHIHDFPWDGKEPHVHAHRHAPLVHSHPHVPDIHHRHRH